MTTRCCSPPLNVEKSRVANASVPVAARASRAMEMSAWPLDLERTQVRVAAHQRKFEHRVIERRMRVLRDHRDPPGQRRAAPCRDSATPSSATDPLVGRKHPREQPEQRRLAGSVGSEDAEPGA